MGNKQKRPEVPALQAHPVAGRLASTPHSVRVEQYSGPLPHPEMLAEYEHTMPGAAERIFSLTESQSRHRQVLESTVVRGNVSAQARGQWMAFVIAIVAVGGGVVLLALGRSIEGYSTMFVPLTGLAGIFAWTRRRQERERQAKLSQFQHGAESTASAGKD